MRQFNSQVKILMYRKLSEDDPNKYHSDHLGDTSVQTYFVIADPREDEKQTRDIPRFSHFNRFRFRIRSSRRRLERTFK